MKLYLECAMGASGDMIMSALYELLPDQRVFREKMEGLGLPGVELEYSVVTKCGIAGTRITVKVSGVEEASGDAHAHVGDASTAHDDAAGAVAAADTVDVAGKAGKAGKTGKSGKPSKPAKKTGAKRYKYEEVVAFIRATGLPDNVLGNALAVYEMLAEAEAAVHGVKLADVHLHELGSLDAAADIIGCCLLMNMLGVTDVTASPIHVGSGAVKCDHGILPVPAPATAEILKGVPIYGGAVQGELCTPTGAALLKRFVRQFGPSPVMTVVRIGCGMGAKDFDTANCIRAFLYEGDEPDGGQRGIVYELSCNLDDMSPEAIGAAFDLLLEGGALDVYATPILMKKNRPATMLSCLCTEETRDALSKLMLEHTTTLGVRIAMCSRNTLSREMDTVQTEYGPIRVKRARGFGIVRNKPEYDDVQAAAKRNGVPFAVVYDAVMAKN
jgi:uncharacterized protein (TIGR00299 family) protein